MRTEPSVLLRVSHQSKSTAVAGAIAGALHEHEEIALQTVGAAALNQAIKAAAIARNYLERDQLDLICVPVFVEIHVDGRVETAIRLLLQRVPRAPSPGLADSAARPLCRPHSSECV